MSFSNSNCFQSFDAGFNAPLLQIPVVYLVPIPLHLFLGLTNDRVRDLTGMAREFDPNLVDEIEKIFRQNGIDNRAWYGDLVGKQHFF